MSPSGVAALQQLATEMGRADSAASSHWKLYSKNFSLEDSGLATGIQGFGENRAYYSSVARLFHRAMQRRWRNPAKSNEVFPFFDAKMEAICKAKNKAYSLDALRQTLTLATLDAKGVLGRNRFALVIGDGFANMSSLLIESGVAQKVIVVNLNTTLYVDVLNLIGLPNLAHDRAIQLVTSEKEASAAMADDDVKVIALQAEKHDLLAHLDFDLAFNIASMQEMDLSTIQSYFGHLRAAAKSGSVQFYCCNRDSKALPDGSIINFDDYGWHIDDVHIIDEECDWHRHYYRRFMPFYFKFDGTIRHRFTALAVD